MSDPLRTDGSRAAGAPGNADAPDPDRDAKIEQLLLAGLDHYFAAQYEQAINIWTRALFLDRTHAKARAYIERARSALAERQRESEEMLQHGVAAYERGDAESARQLLQTAVSQGAPSDEALAFLDRLDRLDANPSSSRPVASSASRVRGAVPVETTTSRWPVLLWALVATVLVVGIALVTPGVNWRSLAAGEGPAAAPVLPTPDSALPMPRSGEMALDQARVLSQSGHLREALVALSAVRPTDPQRAAADQLQARIQRDLLSLTSPGGVSGQARAARGETQP